MQLSPVQKDCVMQLSPVQWEGWVGEFCQFNYIISSVFIGKKC